MELGEPQEGQPFVGLGTGLQEVGATGDGHQLTEHHRYCPLLACFKTGAVKSKNGQ